MSLIVAVCVPTGIVMSGDSRTSVMAHRPNAAPASAPASVDPLAPEPTPPILDMPPTPQPAPYWIQTGLIVSDSTYKVIDLYKRYGVSTCGASYVDGMPIAHHIEVFQFKNVNAPETVNALSEALLIFFRAMVPIPNIFFHVTGYVGEEPWIVVIDVSAGTFSRLNSTALKYGAWWNGDTAIAGRLAAGTNASIDCSALNVQDAVDLSRHLIRTTIDQMRFELSFPTVGGPTDTLLVTPKVAEFLKRKELTCT